MNAFTRASLSAAITTGLALVATAGLAVPALANAAQLSINGSACGTYSQATFTGAGALALTEVQNCQLGEGGAVTPPAGDENYRFDAEGYDILGFNSQGYNKQGYDKDGFNKDGYDKDGFNKDGYDKDGYDKNGLDKDGNSKSDNEAQTGIPSYCKNQNPSINFTVDGYVSTARQDVVLSGTKDYIAKLIPGEGLGYGSARSYPASGSQNSRTFAVSECPGDFTEHLPKKGICIAEKQGVMALNWTNGAQPDATWCQLDEGKTYYFNVRNVSRQDLNKTTCTTSTCKSHFDMNAAPRP